MAQPLWKFTLVDATGTLLGELPLAANRAFTDQLNAPKICSFTLPLTSVDASLIVPGSTYVKAYRIAAGDTSLTKTLRFYGPVWHVEEHGDSGGLDTMLVTAFDPSLYLSKRFTTYTTAGASVDQGAIIKSIIDTTNTANDTGIRTTVQTIPTSTTRIEDWSSANRPLLEVLQSYAEASDGVDISIDPIEYTSGKIADLYVYNRKGSVRSGAQFGYGPSTIANCMGFSRSRTLDNVANNVLAYNDTISSPKQNTTSQNSYRMLQADLNFPEVTDATVMGAKAQGYLDLHDQPSSVAEFTLVCGPRAPRLWDDFVVGDYVGVKVNKGVSFNANLRVYSATLAISDQGVESFQSLEVRAS